LLRLLHALGLACGGKGLVALGLVLQEFIEPVDILFRTTGLITGLGERLAGRVAEDNRRKALDAELCLKLFILLLGILCPRYDLPD
jgi:hypothetical protein